MMTKENGFSFEMGSKSNSGLSDMAMGLGMGMGHGLGVLPLNNENILNENGIESSSNSNTMASHSHLHVHPHSLHSQDSLLVVKEENQVQVLESISNSNDRQPDHDHDGGEQGEVDIILNNVVASFRVRCHLNLKRIAQTGQNVEFHKGMAMLIMKLRRPRCTASIWSSGKITMTGSTTEIDAKVGARRCARILQKLGFPVRFSHYRIVNVLATCTIPFPIKIAEFASTHPRIASYEPELHPAVIYKIKDLKATLKIFSTGSVTITAPKVENIQSAVEQIYPLLYDFKIK